MQSCWCFPSTNIWRGINFLCEMTDDLHSPSRATRSQPKDAHVQQIFDNGSSELSVQTRKVTRCSCGRLVDKKKIKTLTSTLCTSWLTLQVNVSIEVRPIVNQKAFISYSQPSAQHIVGTTLFYLKLIYLGTKKKNAVHVFLFFSKMILLASSCFCNIFPKAIYLQHSSLFRSLFT